MRLGCGTDETKEDTIRPLIPAVYLSYRFAGRLSAFVVNPCRRQEIAPSQFTFRRSLLAKRIGAVLAMFSGAAVGAVVIGYSIAAALGVAAAISALCNVALVSVAAARPASADGK